MSASAFWDLEQWNDDTHWNGIQKSECSHLLLARVDTRDDALLNSMEADNNGVCMLKNHNIVGNEDIEKVQK